MKLLIIGILSFLSPLAYGDSSLFDTKMSEEQKKEAGIFKLTTLEKHSLENWIETNFTPKANPSSTPPPKTAPLTLSINVEEGARLGLSDGTAYEVAPNDRFYATYWVTPFQVTLGPSNDPDYPLLLTNLNTGTSVRVKQIPKEELVRPPSNKIQPTPSPQQEDSSS